MQGNAAEHAEVMRYVLVIPAYNEQGAIAGTLRRALAARELVISQTPVTEMTVVVVNDGSRDGTQEIIEEPEFDEVVRVRFSQNRGYGAAIKAGFRAAPGELVGFLDADGTCDPAFSVPLIHRLLATEADVVLASRLNADSKMPRVRRFGNRLFATLLSCLAGSSVVDTASGFRIIRRTSLRLLSPLPNGLHFTPAMSCICALDPRLRIAEAPMPYEERIGRSKLSVITDGFRFLYTILFSFCCYSPLKSALAACVALIVACIVMMLGLLRMGGDAGLLLLSLGVTAGLSCTMLIWTGLVVHQLNYLLIGPRRHLHASERWLQTLLYYKCLMGLGLACLLGGGLTFVLLGIYQPLAQAALGLAATGGLIVLSAAGMAALTLGLVTRVIWAVNEKQKSLVSEEYEWLGEMEIRAPREMVAG